MSNMRSGACVGGGEYSWSLRPSARHGLLYRPVKITAVNHRRISPPSSPCWADVAELGTPSPMGRSATARRFLSSGKNVYDAILTCMGGDMADAVTAAERSPWAAAPHRRCPTCTPRSRRCRRPPTRATTRASLPKGVAAPAGRGRNLRCSTVMPGAEGADVAEVVERSTKSTTSRIGGVGRLRGAWRPAATDDGRSMPSLPVAAWRAGGYRLHRTRRGHQRPASGADGHRGGVGKSTWAGSCGHARSGTDGQRHSLEMSKSDCHATAVGEAKISFSDMRSGRMSDDDWTASGG